MMVKTVGVLLLPAEGMLWYDATTLPGRHVCATQCLHHLQNMGRPACAGTTMIDISADSFVGATQP